MGAFSWISLLLVAGAVLFYVWRFLSRRTQEEHFHKELTRMNRGLMDRPGWVKQPWQHDPKKKK